MTKSSKSKPSVSYKIYLLILFAGLAVVILGLNGTNLNNYCPRREIDCQIYLQSGQTSPYRKQITAKSSGWYYAGHVPVETCWTGWPEFCTICSDNIQMRTLACKNRFPNYSTKPGVGIKMSE